jgi:hypothetical protein
MRSVIALLGRGEFPADGVADYCNNLAKALADAGANLEIVTVSWIDRGWISALLRLWRDPLLARGDSALLQYTAMAWSKRGFPLGALFVIATLRARGVRCGVVMHEPWKQGTVHTRLIDKIRGIFQDWLIRSLHSLSALSIFTLPLSQIPWLPSDDPKSVFIPLGPNVPEILSAQYPPARVPGEPSRTVCVFCVSDLPGGAPEISDISSAARAAASAGVELRVIFVGRGTEAAAEEIAAAFEGSGIEIENRGLREPLEISRAIVESNVLLCVRGALNLRRGSALAGIACGVPIVGYAGAEHGTPLTEAGVLLVPLRDQPALGAALTRMLQDERLAVDLHRKNIATERKYFSWEVVARQYLRALKLDSNRS